MNWEFYQFYVIKVVYVFCFVISWLNNFQNPIQNKRLPRTIRAAFNYFMISII